MQKNPSGAVQQAGTVQPATCTSDGEVTSLLSVDEQQRFGMQSDVLQLSHEYLEMLGLVRSWWIKALQCAVSTKSIKEGRTGMTANTTTGPHNSAKHAAAKARVECSAMSTSTTWMKTAHEAAMFSKQLGHSLWTFFLEIALLSAAVILFQIRSYLVYS